MNEILIKNFLQKHENKRSLLKKKKNKVNNKKLFIINKIKNYLLSHLILKLFQSL